MSSSCGSGGSFSFLAAGDCRKLCGERLPARRSCGRPRRERREASRSSRKIVPSCRKMGSICSSPRQASRKVPLFYRETRGRRPKPVFSHDRLAASCREMARPCRELSIGCLEMPRSRGILAALRGNRRRHCRMFAALRNGTWRSSREAPRSRDFLRQHRKKIAAHCGRIAAPCGGIGRARDYSRPSCSSLSGAFPEPEDLAAMSWELATARAHLATT